MSKLKSFAEKLFSVDGLIQLTAVCLCIRITCDLITGNRDSADYACVWLWILFVYWEVRRLGDKIEGKHK